MIQRLANGLKKHSVGMAFDAVEGYVLILMVVFQIAPAVPVRTPAECKKKNLDIGSGHNTQTARLSMRESKIQKEKRIKNM